jgi:AraC-like DNA-binding protein
MMEVAVADLGWRAIEGPIDRPGCAPGCATIAYVTHGPVEVGFSGRAGRLCGPGMMVMIPSGLAACFATGDSGEPTGLLIGEVRVQLSGAGLLDRIRAPIFADLSESAVVAACIDELIRMQEQEPRPLGADALANSLMKTCILTLLQDFFGRPGIDLKIVGALADPRLAAVIAAVLERPQGDHSLVRMAERAGLSRPTFTRLFAAAMGQSPIEFVTKTRLYYAAELLRTSLAPVKSVAASVGFSSRSHFSRAFSLAYGLDPTGYRQAHGGERVEPVAQSLKRIEASAGRAL